MTLSTISLVSVLLSLSLALWHKCWLVNVQGKHFFLDQVWLLFVILLSLQAKERDHHSESISIHSECNCGWTPCAATIKSAKSQNQNVKGQCSFYYIGFHRETETKQTCYMYTVCSRSTCYINLAHTYIWGEEITS